MRGRNKAAKGLLPGTLGAAIVVQALSGGWAVANLPEPQQSPRPPIWASTAGGVPTTPPAPPPRKGEPDPPRAMPPEQVPLPAPTPPVPDVPRPQAPNRPAPPPSGPVDLKPVGDLLGGLLPVLGSARLAL